MPFELVEWDVIDPERKPIYREAALVDPLRGGLRYWVAKDLLDPVVPFEILEDVAYLMQKAKDQVFYVPTKHADRLRAFSTLTPEMAGLVGRCHNIHWVTLALDNTGMVESLAKTRAARREVVVGSYASLERWLPHDYSFNPKDPGLCELCEEPLLGEMHDPERAQPRITLVRCDKPSPYLLAQCRRGMVHFTKEVF